MGNTAETMACPSCGRGTAELRAEGFYCGSCRAIVAERPATIHHEHFPHLGDEGATPPPAERAVHHAGFPHVVSAEDEP